MVVSEGQGGGEVQYNIGWIGTQVKTKASESRSDGEVNERLNFKRREQEGKVPILYFVSINLTIDSL